MSTPDKERAHLVPKIYKSRREGYEIEFERINRFGERAGSMIVGELTIKDLRELAYALNYYLDEGQYQE